MAVSAYAIDVDSLEIVPKVSLHTHEDNFSGEIILHPTDGSLHIAWVNDGDIFYTIKAFDGTWSPVEMVPDAGYEVFGIEEGHHLRRCIAMTFDSVGVLHFIFAVEDGDVYYLKKENGIWTDPLRIVDKGGKTIYTDIEIIGDVIHVVYEHSDEDLLYYLKYDGEWHDPGLYLAIGEAPALCKGTDDRLYFYCRGKSITQRNVKFAYLLPGAEEWVWVRNSTDAEISLGHEPHMIIGDGGMYLVWPSNTGEPVATRKGGVHCAYAREPGLDWDPRLGKSHPLIYDNTTSIHPRGGLYSDGTFIVVTGARLKERYEVWNGEFWSAERLAPWDDGDDRGGIYPEIASDGRTVWVLSGMNEIALYGIRHPNADLFHPPLPVISADTTDGYRPMTVQFTGTFPGEPDTWLWDFGDGQTSSLQNPTHVYEAVGTYTVTLTTSGTWGTSTAMEENFIHVMDPLPVADFTADPLEGLVPLTVQHTDASSGIIDSWYWTFGDGITSTLQHPVHEYTAPGLYDVTLTVSGPWGSNLLTREDYVSVTGYPPVADFSGEPTVGMAPMAVQFSDSSSGIIDSWSWTFGDGATSIEQHPLHVYETPGTYSVTLEVGNPWGASTEIKPGYVGVLAAPPDAQFDAEPTRGVIPLEVAFSDRSEGTVESWSWTFGDGATSEDRHPSHTYAVAGAYDVSLTVTGPAGTDTRTMTDYIIAEAPEPVADFIADTTKGVVPLEVHFTDLSTGSIDSWAWNFGDGGLSNERNPVYAYTTAGVYDVILQVSGPGGSDSMTREQYIQVDPQPLYADFYADVVSGDAPLPVQFTDLSTGSIDAWVWDFGDGQSSTESNPAHTYANAGTFSVSLTVTNADGSNTTSKEGYIVVSGSSSVLDAARPDAFRLHHSFPNPFNPSTTIRFDVPSAAHVSVSVFDLQGKRIRVLEDARLAGGCYEAVWDGADERGMNVSSGMYLIVMQADGFTAQHKVLFLK